MIDDLKGKRKIFAFFAVKKGTVGTVGTVLQQQLYPTHPGTSGIRH